MIQEGYDKVCLRKFCLFSYVAFWISIQYKSSAFKVANLNRWMVVINSPKLIEELRKAPGYEISFSEAANEVRSFLFLSSIYV